MKTGILSTIGLTPSTTQSKIMENHASTNRLAVISRRREGCTTLFSRLLLWDILFDATKTIGYYFVPNVSQYKEMIDIYREMFYTENLIKLYVTHIDYSAGLFVINNGSKYIKIATPAHVHPHNHFSVAVFDDADRMDSLSMSSIIPINPFSRIYACGTDLQGALEFFWKSNSFLNITE